MALTPLEKQRIETEAKRVGLSLTDLIVLRCAYPREALPTAEYGQKVPPLTDDGPDEHYYAELGCPDDFAEPPQAPVPEEAPPGEASHEMAAEPDVHFLELDGAKVKCCHRCYMHHGSPHRSCKQCLALNGK